MGAAAQGPQDSVKRGSRIYEGLLKEPRGRSVHLKGFFRDQITDERDKAGLLEPSPQRGWTGRLRHDSGPLSERPR